MPTSDEYTYYVYILTNSTRILYVGVTGDMEERMDEHKKDQVPGFPSRYNLTMLAYYETAQDVWSAVEREKEIKGWGRVRQEALVESMNPEWRDLSEEWG